MIYFIYIMKFYKDSEGYKYYDVILKENVTAVHQFREKKVTFYLNGKRHNAKNAALYWIGFKMKFFFLNGKIFRSANFSLDDFTKETWRKFNALKVFI